MNHYELYRPGVCIVVKHPSDQLVLSCHRSGSAPEHGWQFPQGGLLPGEDVIQGAFRELYEEVGLKKILIEKIATGPYSYRFPRGHKKASRYIGQAHQWVLGRLTPESQDINLFVSDPPEFDLYQWISVEEAFERITPLKKEVYLHALSDLGLLG